jgi:Fe-S-cluster containining protein
LEGCIEVDNNLVPIDLDETFRFECCQTIACFNECCRNLNQFLYPYDILRLKRRLGLSSGDFLKRYTTQHLGPASGLPIVSLASSDAERLTCPFVTANGCSVYPDRPSSCRIYPLVREISRNRATGEINERFMLLGEPHCLGFGEPKWQTVRQWIKDQGVETYNQINDHLMEIISLKNRLHSGPLDPRSQHLFYAALYDLDNFRNQIFNNKLLDCVDVDPQKLAAARTDDTALLEIALEWVKQATN